MNRGRYGDAPREKWLKKLNKSSESVKREGQKLQLPVRFESRTLEIITKISQRSGVSKAEVVRRLVNLGFRHKEE
jgi:allophanate hydrolase subunit 1